MGILCKTSSIKQNNRAKGANHTKPASCKYNVLYSNLFNLATTPEFIWNNSSRPDRMKNEDTFLRTNNTCNRLRDSVSKIGKTINVAIKTEKWHTGINVPNMSTFNANSRIVDRRVANLPRAKSCKSYCERKNVSSILTTSILKSGNCSKKFQRHVEDPIRVAATPLLYTNKLQEYSITNITNATSSAPSVSILLNNASQQKSSHHKAKCRGKLCLSKSRRNSAMNTTVETVPTKGKTTKNMIVLPNTEVAQMFTPAQNSMSLSTVELKSSTAVPLTVPALTLMFLHAPVFPHAWQQFVKLLQNYVEGLTATYRMFADEATPTTATKIAKMNLNDHTTLTTSIPGRCKAAAAAISSVHSTGNTSRTKFRFLPSLGATSIFTILTLLCLETILLSTVSNCAKTFYMHWNTSNSIFRIDNTDHIIDVNKGNLAFEFDQVHIICPVYEPGTYENETEKYIIYNVSKVEYETCRITNADPRVIAICDKPQKLMFFTITFRPFTPQPGGLEFLPGNDYYFISTSSKDDLYRRIGGRCSTNNMKVVFKVCCALEEKNKTSIIVGNGAIGSSSGGGGSTGGVGIGINSVDGSVMSTGIDSAANLDAVNIQSNINQHLNNINTIGINGVNTGLIGGVNNGVNSGVAVSNGGMQLKPMNGASGTSINTNIDQFNRIPIPAGGIGGHGGGGILLTPGGHGGINMISTGSGIGIGQYPGHPGQSGIRINNVASQQHHSTLKNDNNNDDHFDKHPNEVVKNEELTYNSGSTSMRPWSCWKILYWAAGYLIFNISGWLLNRYNTPKAVKTYTTSEKKLSSEASLLRLSARYRKYVVQPRWQNFVKHKYLAFDCNTQIICAIVMAIAIVTVIKVTIYTRLLNIQQTTKAKNTLTGFRNLMTTAKSSNSLDRNWIVPHFLPDNVDSSAIQKPTLLEFKPEVQSAIINTKSVSLSSSIQPSMIGQRTHRNTRNKLLFIKSFNMPLIKACCSKISSVNVKVKRFR